MAIFTRPKDVKIWEMCKWVDDNMYKLTTPGEHIALENKAVEYLYHIVDSLAHKYNFFKKYEYYEDFALYTAGNIYNSLRYKLVHAGEIKRGKEIVPIKSCLNYIKASLYPSKVDYERRSYRQVFNSETGVNTEKICENMREDIRDSYRRPFEESLKEVMQDFPKKLYEMLYKTSPYRNDKVMIQRLYLSIVLSLINQLTLPNKYRNKLENGDTLLTSDKVLNIYLINKEELLLWHLPSEMSEYVRIQLVKAKRIFADELNVVRSRMDLSDEMVDAIISTGFSTYDQDRGE